MIRLAGAALSIAIVGGLVGCGIGSAAPATAPQPVDTTPVRAASTAVMPAAGGGPEELAAATLHRPPQPSMAARLRPVLVADPCVDRDLRSPVVDDPVLTLLDRSYALPPDFAPSDLVAAAEAGFTGASAQKQVRAVVIDDLAAMREAWQAEGLVITIDSAYRSYAAQAATFDAWVARVGEGEARARAARPGHSEHQLGTAIDVSSPGWAGRFGDWAADTAEGRWLAEHAAAYGFVMSYPAKAAAETCFSYEPWHYRWIGREAAADHVASGVPLRTFLEERLGG